MNSKIKVQNSKLMKRIALSILLTSSFFILNSSLFAQSSSKELAQAHEMHNQAVKFYQDRQDIIAESLFRQALAVYQKHLEADDPKLAQAMHSLASVYYVSGKYSAAEPLFCRAVEIRKKYFSPDHPELAESSQFLGAIYVKQKKYAEAELFLKESFAAQEKQYGAGNPKLLGVMEAMRELLWYTGKRKQAHELKLKEEKILAVYPQYRIKN